MIKPYFPPTPAGLPAPLRTRVDRQVRFEEVDPLGIVWHGRYASYFEDGRAALGQRHGIGYMDFHRHGVAAPVKQMHVDYHLPLRFPDAFSIEAVLHWSAAVRLNFEFVIRSADGQVTTSGYTVQLLLDAEGRVLLVPPPFFAAFLARWRAGEGPA